MSSWVADEPRCSGPQSRPDDSTIRGSADRRLVPSTVAIDATSVPALGPDDLIAAYYTLARVDRHGVARTPFPERVAAAADAGFAGIGIQPHDYLRSKEAGFDDRTMAAVLAERGVALAEL